ncbi:hypothetical protein I3842_08G105600 [Carya illinoinensis]|uniref:Uncharacterized protein n=1 Tax=Carya illinoinensis TaxID=32201 RepID=A0A922EE00_CARIL|nr:hypothetical protein I3842_08G105600 [Carya illinoinensis]
MGFSKTLVIEQKSFEVSREGRWVVVTEKGWKLVKTMRLELTTARWFSKALDDCVKERKTEFYAGHRVGDRGFIAQRCSNLQGVFMALVEYYGGGRRNCIFIPEDFEGLGWRKMVETLKEMEQDGGLTRATPAATLSEHPQWPSRSYKEALQQKNGKVLSLQQAGLDDRVAGGRQLGRKTISEDLQGRDGGEKETVGLNKETYLRVMTDMQIQLEDLQLKLKCLKKLVEDGSDGGDLGVGPEDGLSKGVGALCSSKDKQPVVEGFNPAVLNRRAPNGLNGQASKSLSNGPSPGNGPSPSEAQRPLPNAKLWRPREQVTDAVDSRPPVPAKGQTATAKGQTASEKGQTSTAKGQTSENTVVDPGELPGLDPTRFSGGIVHVTPATVESLKVKQKTPVMMEQQLLPPREEVCAVREHLSMFFPEICTQKLPNPSTETKADQKELPVTVEHLDLIEENGVEQNMELVEDSSVSFHQSNLAENTDISVVPESQEINKMNSVVEWEGCNSLDDEIENGDRTPFPLNCELPGDFDTSTWVFNKVKDIQHVVGLKCVGYEEQFLALLTAIEAGHMIDKKMGSKKQRELKRLNWSLNEGSSSRDRSKGKGTVVSL